LAEQRIGLDISVHAVDTLGEAGFDPVYGARPLKRAIQAYIETPLAQALLEGKFGAGDTINIDAVDGKFTFQS
jgi:ATP-dependent Clp protease ATP-binding subunit ClpB